MRTVFTTTLLVAALIGTSRAVRAQAIWNPNYPQTWPLNAYQPSDRTLPFSERYGYYNGPSWFFGMSGRQAYYLEYLDRVDRAERFGRPIPPPPPALCQPPRRWVRPVQPVIEPVEVPLELAPPPTEVKR
jgi:hypothetical protein